MSFKSLIILLIELSLALGAELLGSPWDYVSLHWCYAPALLVPVLGYEQNEIIHAIEFDSVLGIPFYYEYEVLGASWWVWVNEVWLAVPFLLCADLLWAVGDILKMAGITDGDGPELKNYIK